ncbi:MAG TPA: rhomboid family intramembrane serine protease [Paludibacter sp.]|nr:rhomboid family intramembrane serine protease [Paludibacter sp.]
MITVFIVVFTSLVSYLAFNNSNLMGKLVFCPLAIGRGGWYRFVTHSFVHADWAHLIFNMFALYLFGTEIERVFVGTFGVLMGMILYVLLYLLGSVVSIIPTWLRERSNANYRSLGASGGVSALVFAYILVYPMSFMGVMFIPVFLPSFLFGIIYVVASIYMEKKNAGNINHMAHVSGAVFGIVYMVVVFGIFAGVNLFSWFAGNIQIDSIGDLIHFGY